MGKLYFDITDLIDFFRSNHQVTGIQRVQIKILSALHKQGPECILCLAYDKENGRFRTYQVEDLFNRTNTTPGQLLQGLSSARKGYALLNKASVRRALQQYSHRKIYRGIKKAELYITKVIAPSKLARLGYYYNASSEAHSIPHTDFQSPQQGDMYVVLGHNWNTPAIHELAMKFRARQGHAIQVIHDVIAATAPQYFPMRSVENFRKFLENCTRSFDTFVCVSENTKQDLQAYLGNERPAQTMATLRLAHTFDDTDRNEHCHHPDNETLEVFATTRYVICVGTIEPRKNGVALLDAWGSLHRSMGEHTPTLVFVGKLGWKTEAFMSRLQLMQASKVPIALVTTASDRDLHYLYRHCMFSIYPSLYEGWGLPVGESAWLGKTCLASHATSIPEVCGDAIEYFDARNPQDMLTHIERLCRDEVHLNALEQRILSYPLRTWDNVAIDFLDLIRKPNLRLQL